MPRYSNVKAHQLFKDNFTCSWSLVSILMGLTFALKQGIKVIRILELQWYPLPLCSWSEPPGCAPGKEVSCTACETIRNIVFMLGNAEIITLLSRGLTKDNLDHCDGCHLKATFHLMLSICSQRATGKIQRNNYHHGSCGPFLTSKTMSVFLIFMQGTHRNVKNRSVP